MPHRHTPCCDHLQEGRPSDETAGTSLPHCSLSCWAVIIQLCRWSGAGKRHGGFDDSRHKQACKDLLDGLFRAIATSSRSGCEVPLVLDEHWQVAWPRPECGRVAARLVFSKEGFADIAGLRRQLAGVPASKDKWWNASTLEMCWGGADAVPMIPFMVAAMASKRMGSFVRQVFWHLGWQLQVVCMQAIDNSPVGGISMATHSILEALTNAPLLDRMLVSYVESGKAQARQIGSNNYSCSTDKASVGGLGGGLSATVIGLGSSNVAVLGVPQAATGGSVPVVRELQEVGETGVGAKGLSPRPPRNVLCDVSFPCFFEMLRENAVSRTPRHVTQYKPGIGPGAHVCVMCVAKPPCLCDAFCAPPAARLRQAEVAPAADDTIGEAKAAGGAEAAEEALASTVQRQRIWVKRREQPNDLSSCRPQKRHRVGAKHWCMALDNTFRVSLPISGLGEFLQPSEPTGAWATWKTWLLKGPADRASERAHPRLLA